MVSTQSFFGSNPQVPHVEAQLTFTVFLLLHSCGYLFLIFLQVGWNFHPTSTPTPLVARLLQSPRTLSVPTRKKIDIDRTQTLMSWYSIDAFVIVLRCCSPNLKRGFWMFSSNFVSSTDHKWEHCSRTFFLFILQPDYEWLTSLNTQTLVEYHNCKR